MKSVSLFAALAAGEDGRMAATSNDSKMFYTETKNKIS